MAILNVNDHVNTSIIGGIFQVIPGEIEVPVNSHDNSPNNQVSVVSLDSGIALNSTINQNLIPEISVPQDVIISVFSHINPSPIGQILVIANTPEIGVTPPDDPIIRNPNVIIPLANRSLDQNIGDKQAIYKDFALHFKPHPLTGKPTKVLNAEAVKQALRNLILTNYYERPFNPFFGSNIRHKLFENMDTVTQREIKEDIETAILNWEPRVFVINIEVEAKPVQNAIAIKIQFKIKTLEQVETFKLFLERI